MINFLGNYENEMKTLEIEYKRKITENEEIFVINSPKCGKIKKGFSLPVCTRNAINVIEPQIKRSNKISNIFIEEEKLKNTQEFERSSAIRFALRKYLCDQNFNKKSEWENSNNCNKNENCENINEREFKIEDKDYPHSFKNDFKFTIFFPEEFKELWKLFKININDLIISLTFTRLEGFDNPAKSGASFFTSWDKKYFLKSVMSESKLYSNTKNFDLMGFMKYIGNKLESDVEKNFFFDEKNEKDFEKEEKENNYLLNHQKSPSGFINENDRKINRKFRGSFLNYFSKISNERETLLPKFFLLFGFTPLKETSETEIFSIQNGLFPEGTPKIHLIFDLKGSQRKLKIEEGLKKLQKEGKSPNWVDLNFIGGKEDESFFPNGIKLGAEDFKKYTQMIEDDSEPTASITDPEIYRKRFVDFITTKVFKN
uniref:PIPK domain-containing protein n=1 Tax=Meloidogyne hapla TaxID=6305 RepID=A0A1I8AZQ4_MELHA